jgi:hypothetical protein
MSSPAKGVEAAKCVRVKLLVRVFFGRRLVMTKVRAMRAEMRGFRAYGRLLSIDREAGSRFAENLISVRRFSF